MKENILVLKCKSRMLHFGTSFSNNSIKLSSNVPSKSMILGMIGASKGLSMGESQELNYSYSFKWLDADNNSNQFIKKNRMIYDGSLNMRNLILNDKYINDNQSRTLDSVEYIYNKKNNLIFEIVIGNIELDDVDILIESLNNPEYPLYLGKSESMLKIEEINYYKIERNYNESNFINFFIGDSKEYLFKERLVEKMKDYRIPSKLESVYTLNDSIKGLSKNGYYLIEGNNYSIW